MTSEIRESTRINHRINTSFLFLISVGIAPMAFLWKLLYNFRYFIKYVAYALLFLSLFTLLQIWSTRFTVNYRDLLPGFQLFSYNVKNGSKLSHSGPKYILVWDHYYLITNRKKQIFPLQCRVNNCIFTEDKNLLDGDYTRFDALLFSDKVLKPGAVDLPEKRSRSQIYIFTAIESAYNIPACEVYNDNFFNWTFTYRLDSDVLWPYFIVRNVTRDIVAPSINVKWQKYRTRPIPTGILDLLRHKTKAAAWLVSHCKADSSRDDYLTRLQEHLYHFSLQIDVYGGCSKVKCTNDDCGEMFARDYYFYMAFENSFSEDYVTEKVLHGYHNYVVPIVYGGANYTRFLPPGSYLNARELHPYNLAYIMHEVIKDPAKYQEFFKWTNYYTVDSYLPEYNPLCDLCESLNTNRIPVPRTYKRFRLWWNGHNGMKWCLSEEFWNETSLIHVDSRHMFDMY